METNHLCVGITLFHPNHKIIEYLKSLSHKVDYIFVFDNSDNNASYRYHFNIENLIYHFTGKNQGLSKAFNWCFEKALYYHQDYLLLLDQDSCYDQDLILQMQEEISIYPDNQNVAIHAFNIKPLGEEVSKNALQFYEVNEVISSGSFLNIEVIEKSHLRYDENLFVDYVDHDFCHQIHDHHLKIIVHDQLIVYQTLGYMHNGRICHSPVRHYYMIRDVGYMNKKYYKPSMVRKKTIATLITELHNCLKEDKKVKKIKYVLKGYKDYKKGVKGEYCEN